MSTNPKPTSAYRLPSIPPLTIICQNRSTCPSISQTHITRSKPVITGSEPVNKQASDLVGAGRDHLPMKIVADLYDRGADCCFVTFGCVADGESQSGIEFTSRFEFFHELFAI